MVSYKIIKLSTTTMLSKSGLKALRKDRLVELVTELQAEVLMMKSEIAILTVLTESDKSEIDGVKDNI